MLTGAMPWAPAGPPAPNVAWPAGPWPWDGPLALAAPPPSQLVTGPVQVGAFYLESIFIDSNMYPLRIRPPDKPGLNLPDNRFGPWGPAGWGDPDDRDPRRSFASDQPPALIIKLEPDLASALAKFWPKSRHPELLSSGARETFEY
jgi:hypothetical protein